MTARRTDEHIDSEGRLVVPVERRIDPAPYRPGWAPRWVNVDLNRTPRKLVTYTKTGETA
jgi:hypothetical protein